LKEVISLNKKLYIIDGLADWNFIEVVISRAFIMKLTSTVASVGPYRFIRGISMLTRILLNFFT
jgi:hypothetical protein